MQTTVPLPTSPYVLRGCARCEGMLYWRDVPMGNEFSGRELVCLNCGRIASYDGPEHSVGERRGRNGWHWQRRSGDV